MSFGDIAFEVEANTQALLKAERLALNTMQRMSGIATATRRYRRAVAGTNAVILDTSKTVAGLRHPNIVAVYETGEADGHLFFAMEYLPGEDLQT
mgnify:CR=1 FL=1